MNLWKSATAENGEEHLQSRAIEPVILDLLRSRDMRPGDSINIILAQYESERRGISTAEFSAVVVRLLERGLLNIQGNAFYLTEAGFAALRHEGPVGMRRGMPAHSGTRVDGRHLAPAAASGVA